MLPLRVLFFVLPSIIAQPHAARTEHDAGYRHASPTLRSSVCPNQTEMGAVCGAARSASAANCSACLRSSFASAPVFARCGEAWLGRFCAGPAAAHGGLGPGAGEWLRGTPEAHGVLSSQLLAAS